MARSRYNWLRHLGDVSRKHWADFKALRAVAIKTARAWAIKEYASTLWNYISRTWAEKGWKKLLGWMSRSRLTAMVKLARTIRKHLWGIINAIVLSASNGKSESMNSRIQSKRQRKGLTLPPMPISASEHQNYVAAGPGVHHRWCSEAAPPAQMSAIRSAAAHWPWPTAAVSR